MSRIDQSFKLNKNVTKQRIEIISRSLKRNPKMFDAQVRGLKQWVELEQQEKEPDSIE
jgi:hypothetical protein